MGKYRAPLLNNDVIHLVEQNKEPEQKLWIAVLAKAFDDAFYSTDQRAALEALSWIRHGMDFNYVCQLAGRDPNYVRKKMLDKVINREAQILMQHRKIKVGVDNVIKLKKTIAIYQSTLTIMSKGRKICPECKGNGHLRTEMNTIVQCLNCWSEGEIDENIWARDYTPVIPDELQSTKKD